MAKTRRYWLLKSEPGCFSIQDLAASPCQTTFWDGVRNYQARNFMRDMQEGDRVLFYHSNAKPPAVAGTAVVVREAYPDHTAWEKNSGHFDAKASPDNPIWQMVDIQLEEIFAEPTPLDALRGRAELCDMELLRRGSRLSVQPVRRTEFDTVLKIARAGAAASSRGADAEKKKPAKKKATPRKTTKKRTVRR